MEKNKRNNIANEGKEAKSSLDDELKAELIQVLIYSANLLENKNIRSNEISKIIDLSKVWGVDLNERFEMKDSKTLMNLDSEKLIEDIQIENVMDCLVDIASTLGFFKKQEKLEAQFAEYANWMERKECSEQSIAAIEVTPNDYYNQFLNKDISHVEYLANTMFLANQMAHLLNKIGLENSLEREVYDTKNCDIDLVQCFMRIKNQCVKSLIEEKKKGENIDISISNGDTTGSRWDEVIHFALPNYWQPFSMHFDSNVVPPEEYEEFVKQGSVFNLRGLEYSFPLKISPEKRKALEELERFTLDNDNKAIIRMRWFLYDTPSSVKRTVGTTKIDGTETVKKPSRVKEKKYKGKGLMDSKNNEEFLNYIEESLEIRLPEQTKEGILYRASYSFEEFEKRIEPYAREKLLNKGISDEEISNEIHKLFLHIRLTQNISILQRTSTDNNAFRESIDKAVEEYPHAFDYLCSEYAQNLDYTSLKRNLRKHEYEVPEQPSQVQDYEEVSPKSEEEISSKKEEEISPKSEEEISFQKEEEISPKSEEEISSQKEEEIKSQKEEEISSQKDDRGDVVNSKTRTITNDSLHIQNMREEVATLIGIFDTKRSIISRLENELTNLKEELRSLEMTILQKQRKLSKEELKGQGNLSKEENERG